MTSAPLPAQRRRALARKLRARRPTPQPELRVEFIDDHRATQMPIEPDHRGHRLRWPARAVLISVLTGMAMIWVATRVQDTKPSNAAPPVALHTAAGPSYNARASSFIVPLGAVPEPLLRTVTRTLPGIVINEVAASRGGAVAGRDTAFSWSVDASYRRLLISLEIAPGNGSIGATKQIITSGASDVHIVHNSARFALRTVTITVIAPHGVDVDPTRLQQLANQIGRIARFQGRRTSDGSPTPINPTHQGR